MEEKLFYERRARARGYSAIVGIDEAGRGPLAGPVVAAACHLGKDVHISGIDDSKKLTPARRKVVFTALVEHPDVKYGVGIVDARMIDKVNILQATILAMMQAVEKMPMMPDYLLVDGLKLPNSPIPSEKIIKGDCLSLLIAAASIIAKETRDQIMDDYHKEWPEYGFDTHKGYGTRKHMEALTACGPCPIHRETFEPVKSALLTHHN
ncbi:MAG: Ribonuclease HII [Chlamydiae bacterium]|nr:Ribonuclease HII [Chlamydiota bacterium]